ncbi:MAG: GSCFA domain-containing protein, partial [Stellaceae bacterium]
MTQIAYIGSCLSGSIVKELLQTRPDLRLVAGMPHMRLDVLSDYLVDGAPLGAPRDLTFAMIKNLFPSNEKVNRSRLAWQVSERLESINDWLKKIDCLIVDNNYDLHSSLFEIEYGDRTARFVNILGPGETNRCKDLGRTPLDAAGRKYQKLFDYIRDLNPSVLVFFVHYPVASFEQDGTYGDRVERARHLAETVTLRDVHVFPLIKIAPDDFARNKTAYYFSARVYSAYAKAILSVIDGGDFSLPQCGEVPFAALQRADATPAPVPPPPAGDNPYKGLPTRNYWKPAVADRYPLSIAKLYDKKFAISLDDGVATCGSCFAQHIGRRLKANGFSFLDMEPAPAAWSAADAAARGYGIYSARYGNVYTSTQLLQLFQRAFGEIALEEVWESGGRYFDPFRPNLDPDGYADPEEVIAERNRHLAAVRRLFERVDVFIFTMGLTECWYNAKTAAAYPVCPGVTVGQFDPAVHKFHNLSYTRGMADMTAVLQRLRSIKPDIRVLLTVSPVPLTATAENRHVLLSTMHSKSVLRAIAGELAAQHDFVDYFPSYEIVASPPYRGMFFQNNLRTIHDEGVDHVMSHFFEQHNAAQRPQTHPAKNDASDGSVDAFCDELFLE